MRDRLAGSNTARERLADVVSSTVWRSTNKDGVRFFSPAEHADDKRRFGSERLAALCVLNMISDNDLAKIGPIVDGLHAIEATVALPYDYDMYGSGLNTLAVLERACIAAGVVSDWHSNKRVDDIGPEVSQGGNY